VKRYKFQALVSLYPPEEGGAARQLPAPSCRLVVRGRHHETRGSKVFSALVQDSGEAEFRPADPRRTVTMVLVGDDVLEYLGPGDQFSLWLGRDIGSGVVTRRLFT
jgi:hypothetical protein